MLIKTIKLLFKNNASETEKDFQGLNDTLDDTADANEKVNKSFDTGKTFAEVYGDEARTLGDKLGQTTDRLYELATAGDTASDEYRALVEEAGRLRQAQVETDLAIEGASQTFSQKLGPAIQGVTSGFSVAQGAMALFGSENKELEESLLKVQAALAIQQGVEGLQQSFKQLSVATKIASATQAVFSAVVGTTSGVLKIFRLALLGTGIGALVIGVIALIENFDKVKEVIKNALSFALKPLKAAIDAIVASYYAVTDALGITSKAERQREAQAKKNAANAKLRAEREKAEAEQRQKDLEKEIELQRQVEEAEQRRFDRKIRLLESEGKSTIRLRKERAKQTLEEAKALDRLAQNTVFLKNMYKGQVTDAQIAYNDILKEERDYYKQRRQNAEQFRKDQAEIDFGIVDEEIALLAELDKIRQENEARFKTEQQNELDAVEEKYDKLEAMAYGNAEALEQIEIARLNEKNDIELKYAEEAYNAQKALDDKAEEDRKARQEKEIADAKATQQAKIQFANDALGAIGDLANAFAGDSEKSQRRAFKINKAVGLAQAIINTAGAVSAAINPAVGGLGIPAGLPGAILAAATGAAQIATIAKTKFEGGSTGDVSAPSESGLGAVQAPSFNVVGDSSVNQLAQLQQTPTQAFVVSGEVTSAQALDRNRVTNATL